ncbi:MAG TPA: cytochrome-c peroxidase, partial [Anaerolineales bacterium]
MRSKVLFVAGIVLLLGLIPISAMAAPKPVAPQLTDIEKLGEFLYFDTNLSEPAGQSCASCHDPAFGFDDPDAGLPVSEGVIPGLFGGRNSPISAYAMYSPVMYFDEEEGLWIGGQFWDGRATGSVLGDPLADQAVGPFLNPVEMA